MVVKDFGTDEEWQAKALAQQKALTLDAATIIPAPMLPIDDPVSLPAPVAPAYYGPPVFPWQSDTPTAPTHAPGPVSNAPAWKQNA